MTRYVVTTLVVLAAGYGLSRCLLMPWDKKPEPTMAEERKAAFGNLEKKYRRTQVGKPSRRWVLLQLQGKRHAG